MSDASIIIGPPSNTWQSTDRYTSQTRQVGEISLKQNTKQRRGEDIDRLLPPLLDCPLWLLIGEAKDQRGPNTQEKKTFDVLLLLPLLLVIL